MISLKVLTLVFIFVLLVQDGKTWRRRRRRRCPFRNCAVSSWSGWSRCTHKCGSSGTQTRTRRKTQSEACGGRCPYTFRETRACNRHCPSGGTPRGAGCACKGFTGTCCENDINECARKPCQHICTNTRGSFTCSCYSCYKKVRTRCYLGKCKIGNKCYSYGTANPNNFCQHCHAGYKFRWTNNNGIRCNDNKLNTKNDRCSNGACVGTRYSCLPCEQHDGTGCLVKSGYCVIQVGGKKTCVGNNQVNPSNPCQRCDVNKNKHSWTSNNGHSCNDNNLGTKNDRCVNSACVGTPYRCNLPCQKQDGSGCPLRSGSCMILVGGKKTCFSNNQLNPSNQCQRCDVKRNKHSWTNNNGHSCNDYDVGTMNDRCVNSACVGTPYRCNLPCEKQDGRGCPLMSGYCVIQVGGNEKCFTNNQVNPSNPCQRCDVKNKHSWTNNNGHSCNDNNVGTKDDRCVNSACVGTPYRCNLPCQKQDGRGCPLKSGYCVIQVGGKKKCFTNNQVNPSNQCQRCDVKNKHSWTNNNGHSCNDNYVGTKNDRCVNSACVGTPYRCNLSCQKQDGRGCPLKSGYCVIQVGGKKKCFTHNQVNPSNPCQQCNVKSQHKWTINNSLSCSDNNVLTRHDRCVNGTCVGSQYSCLSCEQHDGKGCKLRSAYCVIRHKGVRTCFQSNEINPSNQCQQCNLINKYTWSNNDTLPCNDSDVRTKDDRCLRGECGGTPYSCLPCQLHDGKECVLKSGYCMIRHNGNRTCFHNKQVNPANQCQLCKPSVSINSWTDKPVVHGNWTQWGDWAKCSKSCNSGAQRRQRNCTNPAPSRCGRQCSGHSTESRACNTHHCPVDGKWSPWRAWSECSKSCGGGKQMRMRTCTSPPPGFGGRNCVGQKVEDRQCNTHRCPVNCKSSSNGGYPHYSNCSKFVICVNGKKQVKCCPAGQHYNPVTKLCDLPKNVACTTREEQYVPIGCFADTLPRAFSRFVANLRNSIDWYNLNKTIDSCAKKVRQHCGWTYFGIQFYGECWSGPDESYNRYNKSKNCVAGVGKAYANYVYQLIE